MTRFKHQECVPRISGFYKVYGENSDTAFAGYWTGAYWSIGPEILQKGSLLLVPKPVKVDEWEFWE